MDSFFVMEIWKDIISYEGIYKISSFGFIESVERYISNGNGFRLISSCVLKYTLDKKGYPYIILHNKNKVKRFAVHRLLAYYFIPNPNNFKIVEHKNDNPSDYRIENLEWSTQSTNIKNGYLRGNMIRRKGELSGNSKLTEKDVLEIRESNLKQKELGIIYSVATAYISCIKSRKNWKHI